MKKSHVGLVLLIVTVILFQASLPFASEEKIVDKTISKITYLEVYNKFIKTNPDITSIQREKLKQNREQWWKETYKDKWIRWIGEVKDVRSEGKEIIIDIRIGSSMSDLRLKVSPSSSEKSIELDKGSQITFIGRLNQQTGSSNLELLDVIVE